MTKRRKQIILSLKSNYGNFDGNDIDKRIKHVKWQTILIFIVVIFTVGLVLFGIITNYLGYYTVHWKESSFVFLAVISLSSVMRLPKSTVELKLLKHLRNIQNGNLENAVAKRLDDELEAVIDKLNNFTTYKIVAISFVLLLLIGGLYVFISENSRYWQYFNVPYMLFYVLGFGDFYIVNRKIQDNIDKYEALLN